MLKACEILVAVAVCALPASGLAITLTNRDSVDQKLVVIEGDEQRERVIKAGQKMEFCEKSCVIRVPEGESYAFDGPETVAVEDGLLFLDRARDR